MELFRAISDSQAQLIAGGTDGDRHEGFITYNCDAKNPSELYKVVIFCGPDKGCYEVNWGQAQKFMRNYNLCGEDDVANPGQSKAA